MALVVVTVELLSGRPILVTQVSLSDTVKTLVEKVEREMDGKSCDLVGPGGQKLRRRASIDSCSIADGEVLKVVMRAGAPPIPPVRTDCLHYSILQDVSVGAQHEGWGRKWSTCSYACMSCGDKIESGNQVVGCRSCKGFWHTCCH